MNSDRVEAIFIRFGLGFIRIEPLRIRFNRYPKGWHKLRGCYGVTVDRTNS